MKMYRKKCWIINLIMARKKKWKTLSFLLILSLWNLPDYSTNTNCLIKSGRSVIKLWPIELYAFATSKSTIGICRHFIGILSASVDTCSLDLLFIETWEYLHSQGERRKTFPSTHLLSVFIKRALNSFDGLIMGLSYMNWMRNRDRKATLGDTKTSNDHWQYVCTRTPTTDWIFLAKSFLDWNENF